jgi:hypothetical protein
LTPCVLTNLKRGNIIFEVTILGPDHLDADFVFEAYEYGDSQKDSFSLIDWVETAKRTGLQGLEIVPSYGCSILAIFRSYTLTAGSVST